MRTQSEPRRALPRPIHGRVLEVSLEAGGRRTITMLVAGETRTLCGLPEAPSLAPGDLAVVDLPPSPGSPDSTAHHDSPRLMCLGGPAEGAWDPEGDALRWLRPGKTPSRMELLWQRQTILRAVRGYFYDQGFLEAQTPLLVRGTCPDIHLSPIQAGDGYLTTSTEYQIKRMIVGGFEKVFTLTQNFRGGDSGAMHNPEFTMLEWARAFDTLDAIEDDAEALVSHALDSLSPGAQHIRYRGRQVQLSGARWERLTVRDALARHLDVALDATFSTESLRAAAARPDLGIEERFRGDPHAVITLLLDQLTPHLGHDLPVFLREWPAFMTTSAALAPGSPALAERSELFIAGIEISDGFPSLRDPALQEALFTRELARRAEEGLPTVELDTRYLAALRQGIPPGAGMALGVDRLVMLLTGQENIRNILPLSWDEL
ncbi:amino acid--tRNA ligase-related protein [Chondromyces apiculatus]|uniref:Translation elongation factor P Lys34:lysine transferase n=1 Tax=Chondromyces apiculatus DSM 436 TaxID=1192034 RepID=A0A017T1J2_9BACT|nr:amino acid--tRNA ligase-related protein [Chondromyces apiculatus]EYF03068.1 Translation elongation factor P Lys34:lysine transferase [Chondromyces apiculatus DSM 436]